MSFDKKEFIESFLEESTERLNSISSDIEKLIKSPEYSETFTRLKVLPECWTSTT